MKRVLMVLGGLVLAIVLIVAVQGYQDARQRADDREKYKKLTDTPELLRMVLAAVKPRKGAQKVPVLCAYMAAGAFRLAEARDLKMTKEGAEAAVLAEMDIVREIAKTGANPVYVIGGLASRVYKQSTSPAATFELQAYDCASGR